MWTAELILYMYSAYWTVTMNTMALCMIQEDIHVYMYSGTSL